MLQAIKEAKEHVSLISEKRPAKRHLDAAYRFDANCSQLLLYCSCGDKRIWNELETITKILYKQYKLGKWRYP